MREKGSFESLLRRLARAGFKRDFVASALLPDWWEPACAVDAALLPDLEFRLARFLGVAPSALRDPATTLRPPVYARAQLRRVRNVERDRLAPALHAAIQIAAAAVRCLKPSVAASEPPPADGLEWRRLLAKPGATLRLGDVLADVWRRGIPVVPVDVLPSPSFQALACVAEGRPAVVVAHKYDEPGRVAFLLAHEVGHVVSGDSAPDAPVVDEDNEIEDDASIEQNADRYAFHLLAGAAVAPEVEGSTWHDLARKAARIEKTTGVDAGLALFAWAKRTGRYDTAAQAVKALYRATGARRLLREEFDKRVDLESATETDRALLRCVYGDAARDATPDRH
jgi:Zn-dependent peptidase ImmA (M78 family)